MTTEYDPKKPIGDTIRELANSAFEDRRRLEIQLKLMDQTFRNLAEHFADLMGHSCSEMINSVVDPYKSTRQKIIFLDEETRNPSLIKYLTTAQSSPLRKHIPLGIDVNFTTFSASDIRELPGYIKLHQAARKANVALDLQGLTVDDRKSPPNSPSPPPMIFIDASKTYEEGALSSNLYPDLPDPKPVFDIGKGKGTRQDF